MTEIRNDIIFTLACPKCNQPLPQGLKKAEMLETLEVNCPDTDICKWKGPAKGCKVEQKTLEEWYGPQYQPGAPGFISKEEFGKMFEQDIKDGKIDLDKVFGNKWRDEE